MYFITKEEELVGKVVAFTHFAQFSEAITIVTEDKGIMVFEQIFDEDDKENHVFIEPRAKQYVLKHDYLRKELHKRGIITDQDIEAYEEAKRAESRRVAEDFLKQKEERERSEFERLSKIYGTQHN